ncbi:hypothetical protein AX769_06235 [Frondihabitans sp. PAMC 28766]|uniref:WXG100 family type VII secretion target n=1 Tax=Frondihabitans sp. PAMC 28766 TaxID=1795630 RepID=UPI00078D258C|nr:WXG100 family type VII secretion target [Frondihabitans sp. PAMC 28766]AMM19825.1 hypothetical protein AX769_06235 [Frondihabitans sp. PAMC 28766]
MADCRVSPAELSAASAEIAASIAELDGRLDQAHAVKTTLVGSAWSGDAASVFGEGVTEWQEGAATVREALSGIARLLEQASVTYETTDDDVAGASSAAAGGGAQ